MTPDTVIAIVRQALEVGMFAAGPLLLASLLAGLVVSIFQAATQINEMTLTFIPKLFVMFLVLVITGKGRTAPDDDLGDARERGQDTRDDEHWPGPGERPAHEGTQPLRRGAVGGAEGVDEGEACRARGPTPRARRP